jgi:hypothetical protein
MEILRRAQDQALARLGYATTKASSSRARGDRRIDVGR